MADLLQDRPRRVPYITNWWRNREILNTSPFSACLDESIARSVCPEDDSLSIFIASRRGPFQWIGVLKSAGWVSIHKSRGHEFLRRTVWEKIFLQDEIIPLSGGDWCRFNQRHVEYLIATACPDTPRYVSIEYWWSFVPFFAVAPSVLWRRCTFDEWSDVTSLRCLLYTRSHVVIVRVARGKQFDATSRRKFDDYTTINVATLRWPIDSVSDVIIHSVIENNSTVKWRTIHHNIQ